MTREAAAKPVAAFETNATLWYEMAAALAPERAWPQGQRAAAKWQKIENSSSIQMGIPHTKHPIL